MFPDGHCSGTHSPLVVPLPRRRRQRGGPRLARRLEDSEEAQAHGLKVWIDKTDLGAGARWKDELQSALANSTAFAVYVGSRGVVNWVWDEVSVALDRAHRERRLPAGADPGAGHRPARTCRASSRSTRASATPSGRGVPEAASGRAAARAARQARRRAPSPSSACRPTTAARRTCSSAASRRPTSWSTLLRADAAGAGHRRQRLGQVLAGAGRPGPAFRGGRLGRPREAARTRRSGTSSRPGPAPIRSGASPTASATPRSAPARGPPEASDLADLVRDAPAGQGARRRPVRGAEGPDRSEQGPLSWSTSSRSSAPRREPPPTSRRCCASPPGRRPHPRRADHAARLLLRLRQLSRPAASACRAPTLPRATCSAACRARACTRRLSSPWSSPASTSATATISPRP